jgi:hypothetical protein
MRQDPGPDHKGSIQYVKKTSGGKWNPKTWLPLPGWPGYQVSPGGVMLGRSEMVTSC